MLKMKEIPKSDRPRERLIEYGVEKLNNEELLSILLTSGTSNQSIKELSLSLLKEVDGINGLSNITYEKLISIKGIGQAKACMLLAALELGKRVSTKQIQNQKITEAKLVFEHYKEKLKNSKQEHFYCLYLDNQKRMIKEKLLFIGTLNQSIVHPREVFKEACMISASSIICIHNHPSGDIFPSKADLLLTKRLKEVGDTLGIPLNDHVIVSENNYYSFYENGDL